MLLFCKDERAKFKTWKQNCAVSDTEKHWTTQYCLQQCRANCRQVCCRHNSEERAEFCFCAVYCNTQSDVFRTVTNVSQYDRCYMAVHNFVVPFLVRNSRQTVLNLVASCYMFCSKYPEEGGTIISSGLWPPRSPHQKFSDFSYWFNPLRASGCSQISQSETLNSLH